MSVSSLLHPSLQSFHPSLTLTHTHSTCRISKEDHEAYVASLDKEQADLEKALATSADEHTKLVAAKQAQEMLLVEHLTNINISAESKGEQLTNNHDNK